MRFEFVFLIILITTTPFTVKYVLGDFYTSIGHMMQLISSLNSVTKELLKHMKNEIQPSDTAIKYK